MEAPKPMMGGLGPTAGPGAPGGPAPAGGPAPMGAPAMGAGGPPVGAPPMGAPLGSPDSPVMAGPASVGSDAPKPNVMMFVVDTLCFLAATAFAIFLYLEFSKTI